MTIIYTFADGTTSIVEVSEELGNIIIDFDRKEDSADRRQRRHNCSLEAYNVGDDLVASDEDIAADFIEKQDFDSYIEFLAYFFSLSTILGYNPNELVEAYFLKLGVNYQRQDNNY